MRFRLIGNTFKETGRNISRNLLITFASLTTMTLMLLVLGAFTLFTLNTNKILDAIGQAPPVEVWLNQEVTDAEIDRIDSVIESMDYIVEYQLVTPEDHYEIFREDLQDDAQLLDSLDPTILPHSFTVRLEGPEYIDAFNQEIELNAGIDRVDYSSTVNDFISTWSRRINIISLAAVVVLFIVALIVISNMTRMSILARAEEISIMKYIGATSSYIRTPYFLEGAFIGFIGGLISILALAVVYQNVYTNAMVDTATTSMFALIPLTEIIGQVSVALLVIGIVVGGIGSGLSVRKYVNV